MLTFYYFTSKSYCKGKTMWESKNFYCIFYIDRTPPFF